MSKKVSVDPKGVFINAPFDNAYEPLFVTLVGVLAFLQYNPHCVLEVRETGEGRLKRIYELMRSCRISIHDMSRISTPVRFNMPFELGLACSLKLAHPRHYDILVLDAKPYRMDRLLSDYKGRDLLIHHGSCDGMISCLLDAFGSSVAEASTFHEAARELREWVESVKKRERAKTIFQPHLFRRLNTAAFRIARERGFALA